MQRTNSSVERSAGSAESGISYDHSSCESYHETWFSSGGGYEDGRELFTMDLAYLQDLYERINTMEMPTYTGICPHCGKEIRIPVNFMEAGQ